MAKALAVFMVVVFCWAFFGMYDKHWPLWQSFLMSVGVSGIATYVIALPLIVFVKVVGFFKGKDNERTKSKKR